MKFKIRSEKPQEQKPEVTLHLQHRVHGTLAVVTAGGWDVLVLYPDGTFYRPNNIPKAFGFHLDDYGKIIERDAGGNDLRRDKG